MVQLRYIILNLLKLKVKLLIYFKNLFVKLNTNLEKLTNLYTNFKKNLSIKFLKNI